MDGSMPPNQQIIPRKGPDFGLDGDIPRHWFGGDPFKTRFFDAMSLLFPEGEKFFIQCVRDYRERITDPQMQADVKDFIYQEGQHGMVHDAYNRRVATQGVAVDHIEARMLKMLAFQRRNFSRKMTLAQTAAAEHMTAIMAHSFMADREMFAAADPRMRALYVWHAIEEIEHKSVAYDVMQKVAKVGYGWRILGMLYLSVVFPLHTFLILRHMLKVDGVKNRFGVWMRGLAWLYGPRGVMTKLLPHYLAYYRPGFHPWTAGQMATYTTWRQVFDQSGDAIAAANALHPVT
ncbi:MAG: metal-dependent hydrolase [Panacagrimonas sp.]|nr:metal-dependent hydrolase [Panacagrimonas sp.]MCC2655128.1 metal-dependent hydrolase [Panacagrimonas sp.]